MKIVCAAFVFVFAVALALIIIKINIVGDVVVCAVCCGRIRIKDQGSESGSRLLMIRFCVVFVVAVASTRPSLPS